MSCLKYSKHLSLLLVAGMTVANATAAPVPIEVAPGGPVIQTSFTPQNSAKKRELIVAWEQQAEGVSRRHLTRYAIEGSGAKVVHDLTVPDDVVAYGTGDFLGKGEPQILYFTDESVLALDPSTDTPAKLLGPHRFFFNRPSPKELPCWDFIADLNGDKLDDLVLADAQGYAVFLQSPDHKLSEAGRPHLRYDFSTARSGGGSLPTEIGGEGQPAKPRASIEIGSRRRRGANSGSQDIITSRSIGRLVFGDFNGDKRTDLLALQDDRLLGFAQSKEGRFSPEPDLISAATRPSVKRSWDNDRTSPVALGDINADGRVDIVVAEIDTKDLATKLRFFLASSSGFPEQPTQILKISGLGEAPRLIDVNNDGFLDLGFLAISTDKMMALKKTIAEELDSLFYVYLFNAEKQAFSPRPDLKREFGIALTNDLEEEQSRDFFHFEGDFTGDGVRDFAAFENRGVLDIYATSATGPNRMTLSLPSSPTMSAPAETPRSIRTADLDADGKSEIVLLYKERLVLLKF